ncbi:hypothetical protein IFM5058_08618 [Aspergillus udagawae]|nr:hypothetical protein IFM5058_08618 [Aspergillus udagawae]
MPKGRPKAHISPCRFCNKQFKRQEHLRRHERTRLHSRETLRLSLRDLLTRHNRVAHQAAEVEASVTSNLVASEHSNGYENLRASRVSQVGLHSNEVSEDNEISVRQELEFSFHGAASEIQNLHNARPHVLPSAAVTPRGLVNLNPSDSLDMNLGPTDELDFLWDNDPCMLNSFLPATFLDTDLSLSDISRRWCSQQLPITPQSRSQAHDNVLFSPRVDQPGNDRPPLPPRFPSLDDHEPQNSDLDSGQESGGCPWAVTFQTYNAISEKAALYTGLKLPSRHALARYLEGYFRGFHDHLPFIHTATCNLEQIALELLLALAAVGAVYRFEHAKGYKLYTAARLIIDQGIQKRSQLSMARLSVASPRYTDHKLREKILTAANNREPTQGIECSMPAEYEDSRSYLQTAQALMVLMALTAWSDAPLVRDSLAMASQLAAMLRDLGINQDEKAEGPTTWLTWVVQEERRRTLLAAYILLNLQSIAFDVPPLILNQEVAICLPSCEAVWKAPSSPAWDRHRTPATLYKRVFIDDLNKLLEGQSIHEQGAVSAFANYVLIHGLLQQIFLQRHASSCLPESPLRADFIKSMEISLRSWQCSWEATWESTLDPSSPKGPLGFNATALLRVAYIRLNISPGPNRSLLKHDPESIAKAFTDPGVPSFTRSPHLDRAVLQCIHALSIPVRVGIHYVAHTHNFHWSVQHALSNLECAFLLTRWLYVAAQSVRVGGIGSLREDEQKLIAMIKSLIRETDLQDTLDYDEDHSTMIQRLAASVVRLWLGTFRGVHSFEIVDVVGSSLSLVADKLESHLTIS